MIIFGDENIYPAESENALASHEALTNIAIIGIPDEQRGEQVKAVVVVKPGAKFDESEFEQCCRARLTGYKIPRSIDIVTELPRAPSGKILKRVLRAPYWNSQERQVSLWARRQLTLTELARASPRSNNSATFRRILSNWMQI